MEDFEGKYVRDHAGWVYGPLKSQREAWVDPEGYSFSKQTLKYLGHYLDTFLMEEALPDFEVVEMTDPPVGTAVVTRDGTIRYVTSKDVYDCYLSRNGDGFWSRRKNIFKTVPSLFIGGAQDYAVLVGKWVWSEHHEDYVQIKNTLTDLKAPNEGFTFRVVILPVGETWTQTIGMTSLNMDKEVLDAHPKEANLVRSIQGEGKYLYATNDEDENFLVRHWYNSEYTFLHLKAGSWNSYTLREGSNIWFKYQVFATDELPFKLPLSAENCYSAYTDLVDNGYSELQHWLRDNCPESLTEAIFRRAKLATNTRGNIALYLNDKQVETQCIQSLRPGRAFKTMLPSLTDAQLEKLVDKFRQDFPSGDYLVKRSFEAGDFKKAYAGRVASMQNPYTTSSRKSLANSCMRHDFSHLKHHPAEAYASGEFEMLWTETPNGAIGSRLVVWHPPEGHSLHGKPQCGPVYGTCEYSMDLLQDLMVAEGASLYHNATWIGAKLARLLKGSSQVYVPYLDHEQALEDCVDYLVITDEDPDDADIAGNNTCGYADVGRNRSTCDACGDREDEDDLYHTDDGQFCQCCYDNRYFRCEEYDDTYPVDEACTVYYQGTWGRTERTVCVDARDTHYTLCTDERYWHTDDVLFLADGSALAPRDQDNAAECDYTNEYYLLQDLYEVADGGWMSKDYFEEHKDEWKLDSLGMVEPVRKEEEAA